MDAIQNIIVIGDGGCAKYYTTVHPVRFQQPMSMAITSICHGPLSNIHEGNNKIYFQRARQKRDITGFGIEDIRDDGEIKAGDMVLDDTVVVYHRNDGYYAKAEVKVGYYKSSLDILQNIKSTIGGYYTGTEAELRLNTTKLGRSKIGVTFYNLRIDNRSDSPWSMLGINQTDILPGDNITDIENKSFESKNMLAFLYVNVVESSYINGKLSRVLSVVPIQTTSGWVFHEFNHPNYVPIVVKEFSNILLELRDLYGNYLHFDTDFKTIITLKIKPINTG